MSHEAAVDDAEAPGPPPLPPADIGARKLPIVFCRAGTILTRIHSAAHEPLFFGPASGSPPRGRWDAPAGEFGVCYLAEQPYVAFAETFLREPGKTLIEESDLALRSVARVAVLRDLALVSLHGPRLAPVGATAATVMGPYATSRAWAVALHGHPGQPDGILYRARHDDDGFAIALFDRAKDAIAVSETVSLTAPEMRATLGGWLDRYGIGLI